LTCTANKLYGEEKVELVVVHGITLVSDPGWRYVITPAGITV